MLKSLGIFTKKESFIKIFFLVKNGQAISFEDCFKVSTQRENSIYWLVFWNFSCLIPASSILMQKVISKKPLWGLLTYLAAATAANSLQSCPTLCDAIDGSPPGSPVPGIVQARTLEWVATSFFNAWKWKVKVKSLSRVRLLATPWTAAYQAPLPMGFSRQEYWSGVPLPSPSYCIGECKYTAIPSSQKILLDSNWSEHSNILKRQSPGTHNRCNS